MAANHYAGEQTRYTLLALGGLRSMRTVVARLSTNDAFDADTVTIISHVWLSVTWDLFVPNKTAVCCGIDVVETHNNRQYGVILALKWKDALCCTAVQGTDRAVAFRSVVTFLLQIWVCHRSVAIITVYTRLCQCTLYEQ